MTNAAEPLLRADIRSILYGYVLFSEVYTFVLCMFFVVSSRSLLRQGFRMANNQDTSGLATQKPTFWTILDMIQPFLRRIVVLIHTIIVQFVWV